MRPRTLFRATIGLLSFLFLASHHRITAEETQCGHGLGWAEPSKAAPRQFARDRKIDVLHLKLDVLPDFSRRTVSGSAELRFRPIAKPIREVRLDAVDLDVKEVLASAPLEGHQVTEDAIVLTFAEPIPVGQETSVSIVYSAEPRQGLYFRTPEMGYDPEETQIWTQGEPIEARHWYPSYDYPNEKFTTELICRVPQGMVALSNGQKLAEETDAQSGLTLFHWLQEKPHSNYLLCLVAGYFDKIEDSYGDVPLAFYTPPSDIALAENSFRDTKDMMGFFEREIGFPYPWSKYYQVVLRDFFWGGMENTTLTTLNDRTLFRNESENIRSSQDLVAHELAHQWFGNLVTCKDWSQLWLNEGFATYYAHLYDGHKNGLDSMRYGLYETARSLIRRENEERPILYRTFHEPEDMFRAVGHLIYGKGAWVLHMLRSELGPELFREAVQAYLERHAYGSVTTEDLNEVLEEISGRSFDRFFDQWVYHGGIPKLKADYSWDEPSNLAKITIRQTHKTSDAVSLFHLSVPVQFQSATLSTNFVVQVSQETEAFYFHLPEMPDIVSIDPEMTLLSDIQLENSSEMLHKQARHEGSVYARLKAIERLSKKNDQKSVDLLRELLQADPFYGVRIKASQALRAIHSTEALEALLGSLEQSDARVRQQVTSDIGDFYSDSAYSSARDVIQREQNPEILSAALEALSGYSDEDVRPLLLSYLASDSFRNQLAVAATRAMRAQDDPAFVEPLLEVLAADEDKYTSSGFADGLQALAFLARDLEDKSTVREFLLVKAQHKKERIQLAALSALGTLGDTQAIAVLERFAAAQEESKQRRAAEEALVKLRQQKRPAAELSDLRNELLELKKSTRELESELKELKAKLDAQPNTENKGESAD